jgi:hypothetical protein
MSNGAPKTEITLTDLSVLIDTGLKGIHGFVGVTMFGHVNKPVLVGSWESFVRNFGGLLPNSDFPLIARRALESGAKLVVSRVGHYTDPSDKTSLVWTPAEATLTVEDGETTSAKFTANFPDAIPDADRITVTVSASPDGNPDLCVVSVAVKGFPEIQDPITVSRTPTEEELAQFNEESYFLSISDIEGEIPFGTVTLTGQVGQAVETIETADYIGDTIAQTGIFSFNSNQDITKIAVPEKAVPAIDNALANYADSRKDIRAILRTPTGLNGAAVADYREGTGIYDHQPVDTWRASMITGGLVVRDPQSQLVKDISELGDAAGAMSKKDNAQGEWFSFAGPKRGRVSNVLGVAYDFGSPAVQAEHDLISNRGVNAVIQHPTFGVVFWGNKTLQKADTMLKHNNVADLVIFMQRTLKPLVESEKFDPNDIVTWRNLHRKIQPFLDTLVAGRAIYANPIYQGDQDVDRIEDAVINSPANISKGEYKARIFVKPIPAMLYIGIGIVVTDVGADFSVLLEQPNI